MEYLYLLEAGGQYKIGHARNVDRRIRALKAGCPFPLKKIYAFRLNDARGEERILHKHFANKVLHGEWFRLDPDDLRFIHDTYAAQHVPPHARYIIDRGIQVLRKNGVPYFGLVFGMDCGANAIEWLFPAVTKPNHEEAA